MIKATLICALLLMFLMIPTVLSVKVSLHEVDEGLNRLSTANGNLKTPQNKGSIIAKSSTEGGFLNRNQNEHGNQALKGQDQKLVARRVRRSVIPPFLDYLFWRGGTFTDIYEPRLKQLPHMWLKPHNGYFEERLRFAELAATPKLPKTSIRTGATIPSTFALRGVTGSPTNVVDTFGRPGQANVNERIIRVELSGPGKNGVADSSVSSFVDEQDTEWEEEKEGSNENGDGEETYQPSGFRSCRTCGSGGSRPNSEPLGYTLTEKEVKEIHLKRAIDLIKKKINIDGSSPSKGGGKVKLPKLPKAILDEIKLLNTVIQEEDNFYARDQEVIVAGSDMRSDCVGMRATGCYDFRFNGQVTEEVESATLWLYKTRDRNDHEKHTFIVYELERRRTSQTLRRRNMIARKEMFIKQGWLDLNVTRAVQRWVAKGRDGEMLAIRCKTCHTENHRAIFGAKHDYKPVLIIKFFDKFRHRERRSTNTCNPVTACCKQDLIVSFANISMHTIVRPPTMNLGYCYGFCEDLTSYLSNYTMIRQRWRYQPISPLLRAQLQPCCVPIKLKPMSILDWDDGEFIEKVLPNVRVEECGCL